MPYIFGELNDAKAAREICLKLAKRNVSANFRQMPDGRYTLFVEDESQVRLAHDFYRVSLGMPPHFEIPPEVAALSRVPFGKVTASFILVCVAIAVISWLSDAQIIRSALMISMSREGLPEIMSGQWWRLFTPALLHFGIIHLVFNMLWLKTLGSAIEYSRGIAFFLQLTFVSAIFSNLLQWYFKGPMFGGMSGVVYAFLGFMWMAKTFNPNEEFSLPKQDVTIMIGWFILCLTGLLGPIANFAHAGGLSIGMLYGIVSGIKKTRHAPLKLLILYVLASFTIVFVAWFMSQYF